MDRLRMSSATYGKQAGIVEVGEGGGGFVAMVISLVRSHFKPAALPRTTATTASSSFTSPHGWLLNFPQTYLPISSRLLLPVSSFLPQPTARARAAPAPSAAPADLTPRVDKSHPSPACTLPSGISETDLLPDTSSDEDHDIAAFQTQESTESGLMCLSATVTESTLRAPYHLEKRPFLPLPRPFQRALQANCRRILLPPAIPLETALAAGG